MAFVLKSVGYKKKKEKNLILHFKIWSYNNVRQVNMAWYCTANLNSCNLHFFLIQNVAIELVAEEGGVPGSQYRKVFLANECNPEPFSASNVERLKSGLEDYVMKHGNSLHRKCDSCFPNWYDYPQLTLSSCYSRSNYINSGVNKMVWGVHIMEDLIYRKYVFSFNIYDFLSYSSTWSAMYVHV